MVWRVVWGVVWQARAAMLNNKEWHKFNLMSVFGSAPAIRHHYNLTLTSYYPLQVSVSLPPSLPPSLPLSLPPSLPLLYVCRQLSSLTHQPHLSHSPCLSHADLTSLTLTSGYPLQGTKQTDRWLIANTLGTKSARKMALENKVLNLLALLVQKCKC